MSKDGNSAVYEIAQECISKLPVIILGSGASAAYGMPGMPGLKDHLLTISCPAAARKEEANRWTEFLDKLETKDLETTLNDVRLSENLINHIVYSTWDFLSPFDYKVFQRAISDRDLFPLTKLFRHLFNSTKKDINIVTPNYDRLAEYAAESGEFAHYTGFNYGNIRTRVVSGRPRIHVGNMPARTVNIWKVHGSLDWFRDSDGIVVGLPVTTHRPPDVSPVIVTPGIEKYRLTHDEPFHSIKSEADRALNNADAYLCIGYGFNDTHLQTTLVERCRGTDVPLVLLTKSISPTARAFLNTGKCGRYMAIEESASGCRIFRRECPTGQEIVGENFWRLDEFLGLVIS